MEQCQETTCSLWRSLVHGIVHSGLPPIRIKQIPWLFTDHKTIFTDHAWCDWVNKAYSIEFTFASVSFAGRQYVSLRIDSWIFFERTLPFVHKKIIIKACCNLKIKFPDFSLTLTRNLEFPWIDAKFPDFSLTVATLSLFKAWKPYTGSCDWLFFSSPVFSPLLFLFYSLLSFPG